MEKHFSDKYLFTERLEGFTQQQNSDLSALHKTFSSKILVSL